MLQCVSCVERENEKNPLEVKNQNFGIRALHSHADLLNNINIDTNAPQTPNRGKPIRIRNREHPDSGDGDNQGKRSRSENSVKRIKAPRFKTKHGDTRVHKPEGFGNESQKSTLRSRLGESKVSAMEVESFEESSTSSFKMEPNMINSKEKVMDNF